MNFMLILPTIKHFTCKKVAVRANCFISDPLRYNNFNFVTLRLTNKSEILENNQYFAIFYAN